MSVAPATVTAVADRRRQGYAMVAVAYLTMGAIGALVRMTTAPESAIVVLRMAIAGVVLGALFARRPMLEDLRRPGTLPRLAVTGAASAVGLLTFFTALQLTDVSIGMFLLFMAPVYVALVAPRAFGQQTDRVVYPALALALGGMAVILLPGLVGDAGSLSAVGVACGVTSGLAYAAYMIACKDLTRRGARSSTVVLGELVADVVFLLPLALVQTVFAGVGVTARDLLVCAVLGVVCTVFAYMMWMEGVRRVRVEHASILGYLEPVSAPLYALLLLGERPAWTTVLGGALIVVAGVLVVRFGERDELVPA